MRITRRIFGHSGFFAGRFFIGATLLFFAGASACHATVINVPAEPAPLSISGDTTLNLFEGGALLDDFTAENGATVNVFAGDVGRNFQAFDSMTNIHGGVLEGYVFSTRGTVNITDGDLKGLIGREGAILNISGGRVWGGDHGVDSGSVANITGGSVESFNSSNATLNIHGGELRNVRGGAGSVLNIHGGQFQGSFEAISLVDVFGSSFLLDGQPIEGLSELGDSVVLTERESQLLTATLEDGSAFTLALGTRTRGSDVDGVFYPHTLSEGSTLRLNLVPEPSTACLLMDLVIPALLRRR